MNRYHRQILFEPLGNRGQQRVAQGRVLICGCGALGGSVAQILVRAGIGFVRLVDDDTVSFDNLHRQFLFSEADAAHHELKAIAAKRTLEAGNNTVTIDAVPTRMTSFNARELTSDVDVLIDGTDNFPTRFLLNETAIRLNKPFVTGGICGASGQMMTVLPGQTPCLACVLGIGTAKQVQKVQTERDTILPEIFPVLSPIVQVISAFEAIEAIKILSGHLNAVCRDLITFDLWENRIHRMAIDALKVETCNVCASAR